MCTVGDDNIDESDVEKYMVNPEKLSLLEGICNKCKTSNPCVVLRNKDKYCKDCFLVGTIHKFKALLGKHKLIRPKDRVLIYHRTGHASAALLHFIRNGLDLTTPKKLNFEPIFVFIEDQFHLSLDERSNIIDQIEKQIKKYGFPVYLGSFTELVLNFCNIDKDLIVNHSNLVKLTDDDQTLIRRKLNYKGNITNFNDYLNIVRRQIMTNIANLFFCKFIFTPEISADIASQLLSNICLGRSSQVPLDTGFCDSRDQNVKILRPLRLFDVKELAFYNRYNNVDVISHKQSEINPYSSIQNLMQKFVNDLQINYPATITTILKTGDKLSLKNHAKANNKCELCTAFIDNGDGELNSMESTEFSHWVSTQVPNYELTSQERYEKIHNSFQNHIDSNYCFSCKKLTG